MYELSIWERESYFPPFDALIIGGGIVGLSASIHLQRQHPSWRIAVVERGVLPSGASTRNAGFACFGSVSELLDDLKTSSESEVFALVDERREGLARLRELIGDANLEYEPCGGYEVFTDPVKFRTCADAIGWLNERLRQPGMDAVYQVDSNHVPLAGICGQIHNGGEGLLHPGQMMRAMQRIARQAGVLLYFGIEIEGWEKSNEGYTVYSRQGIAMHTNRTLLATNGMSRRLIPDLPVQGVRNQVLVTEPLPGLRLRGGFHYQEGYIYFRHVHDRILIGGGRHLDFEGETTDEPGRHDRIRRALYELLCEMILPGQAPRIEEQWSGILGTGTTKRPLVKELDPGLFAAIRLGGMGVAIGVQTGARAAALMGTKPTGA